MGCASEVIHCTIQRPSCTLRRCRCVWCGVVWSCAQLLELQRVAGGVSGMRDKELAPHRARAALEAK